jgi:hypothetical protein
MFSTVTYYLMYCCVTGTSSLLRLLALLSFLRFYYSGIKKARDENKKCRAKTMTSIIADKSLK